MIAGKRLSRRLEIFPRRRRRLGSVRLSARANDLTDRTTDRDAFIRRNIRDTREGRARRPRTRSLVILSSRRVAPRAAAVSKARCPYRMSLFRARTRTRPRAVGT